MRRFLGAWFLLWMMNTTALADPPDGYGFGRYDEALQKAQKSGKPVFVYYGRQGCGFCEKTNKETFSDAGVRQRFTAHYELAYVDSESDQRLTLPSGEQITELELGARMRALVTPIFMFLDANGKEITRVPGFQSIADMSRYDDFVTSGAYRRQSANDYFKSRQ